MECRVLWMNFTKREAKNLNHPVEQDFGDESVDGWMSLYLISVDLGPCNLPGVVVMVRKEMQ